MITLNVNEKGGGDGMVKVKAQKKTSTSAVVSNQPSSVDVSYSALLSKIG